MEYLYTLSVLVLLDIIYIYNTKNHYLKMIAKIQKNKAKVKKIAFVSIYFILAFLLNYFKLFNLGFFVDNMLANYWVVFLDFHFVWRGALIFVCGVVMACASARYQFNFISHCLLPTIS